MPVKFNEEAHGIYFKSLACSKAYFHVNCELDLWPLTYKINRVHPLTMANMSAKFDEEAHSGLVSIMFTSLLPYMFIVTLTFDLWPPKSIVSVLSLWLNVCQDWWRSTQRFSLYCVHKLITIYVYCDLDFWPLTSKFNKGSFSHCQSLVHIVN